MNRFYPQFSFTYNKSNTDNARLGTISTPHGNVKTPNFIFCATKASIKCVPSYQVDKIGADIILANTYHLMLRPGERHIDERGGLHSFMHWDKPMFTDSGGYQVFAMGHGSVSEEIKKTNRTIPKSLLSIEEEGVMFKSYLDGKKHLLSPERSIEIQRLLGADLIVQFDECTPFHVNKKYTAASMRRSARWGDRSLKEFFTPLKNKDTQALYGIIQGGTYEDLRKESVERVESQKFFATAIGGSLGENKQQMYDVVSLTSSLLTDKNRPIHLLGIGDIPDIFHGVELGIDTFDCVHPTRIARHACALVPSSIHPQSDSGHTNNKMNLKNQQYAKDDNPIDNKCPLPCCRRYSRAYIHYLFKAKEFLGPYLLSVHNIGQMVRLMRDIRHALQQDITEHSQNNYKRVKSFWLS